MTSKLLAGSVLAGTSLLAAVLNTWAGHLFFALFHVAKAQSLAYGSFDPGPYGTSPEDTALFVGVRVLIWVLMAAGLVLLAWGTAEAYRAD